MNLLDSVLCTCNAEEYTNNFKQFGIDAFTLKLLNDEDLKIIGILEEEKRSLILQQAANLQIPAEKHVEIIIDKKYIESVLLQMSVHLIKHLATLSIAVNRSDIIICNVKLAPAAKCLRDCVASLDKQINEFEMTMVSARQKQRNLKKVFISVVTVASIVLASYKTYQYLPRLS